MRLIGAIGRRFARRSRWLTERLWVVAALEAAWITNSHWRRLDRDERRRLIQLLGRSRGRPSRLTPRERAEAAELLDKVDYAELGGRVAILALPFRPIGRIVEFSLGRAGGSRRRRSQRGAASEKN
jgi:hypothetical protein